MMTTVIYHSADFDGIFCREIARKFLPEAELIGWNFGDKPLKIPEGRIYVLDLPIDKPFNGAFVNGWWSVDGEQTQPLDRIDWNNFVWIDHHKSAIESHPASIPGYRIDGVAACRLVWQWFMIHQHNAQNATNEALQVPLPGKQDYIDRTVSEPLAVRLAGEYDIWDKRDPNAELFQHGLSSRELTDIWWSQMLRNDDTSAVLELLARGEAIQYAKQHEDASIVNHRSFLLEWEGLKFLALNTARCNSLTFAAKDVPETGHNALLGFYWNGNLWTVSLYHASHRKDIDLSQIAVKHGGGGHKGACGFTCKTLPFSLQ